MAHGGRYVLVGLQLNEISFSHPEFHKREGTLMSSRNATKADFDYVISNIRAGRIDVNKFITHIIPFDYVISNIRAGRIDVNKFITHIIPFEKVKEEFESLLDPARGVVKAVIEMN
jgi:threonine dehydrogenase-like Zn-dependent dehydrogenase